MTFYDELVWRGLIKDVSSEDLKDKLNAGGMTFYIGTDPTGDSLHIGHFSSFLMSKRCRSSPNSFGRWCNWTDWGSKANN